MPDQLALFAEKARLPEGLDYVPGFISREEELELVGHASGLPLQPFQFGQYEGKRRVASFGWRYDYSARRLLPADPIPCWLNPLIHRIETFGGPGIRVAQILCTEYQPGVGIGWHRDKPHFDRIFGISLASSCKLRFRRTLGDTWERLALEVEPRSVYKMSGASRLEWEHSISAVDELRYSVTLRTLKSGGDVPSADQKGSSS
ncbi:MULTISPECIES: alpha-ketoglutarate-dependent dioxygenase AlkB [Rhodopseudomonas]|uniref:alpha-ketoglutarate-dependent dioxygenase AlkB n=1 Tax=Rhodopseudomonas TaxID=1073 RepID=UPI000AD2127E|nr:MULTISPECIES: alpha-ketoglutarate-dependent dioxygenase AlkB [Rhodopseudomonas]MDF3813255.1 alpha-ketoglutarate-dependent dioxygenase AlkB [Rhodopseudomonas sp. BAL398]WOK21029.1 alpha-ketoglutarate-dependent dioxygenase AlkB [Rhodopseudomonas sp. BAL398]